MCWQRYAHFIAEDIPLTLNLSMFLIASPNPVGYSPVSAEPVVIARSCCIADNPNGIVPGGGGGTMTYAEINAHLESSDSLRVLR